MEGHPLMQLSSQEIRKAAAVVRQSRGIRSKIRFNVISLQEPSKFGMVSVAHPTTLPRVAFVIFLVQESGRFYEAQVELPEGKLLSCELLPKHVQPVLTPDDCILAELIVKKDLDILDLMRQRYGIEDLNRLACDPWSVHLTSSDFKPLSWRGQGSDIPSRLVQTFLYLRDDSEDNYYAHPLDLLPIVDLIAEKVVYIEKQEKPPPISLASVNYHRKKVNSNTYLPTDWRSERLAPLNVIQPSGPSFKVSGNHISWQKWSFRVGFNYREGLVLHQVQYESRLVLWRASLVEMAVPYGDPNSPFDRKTAFDVGDYGLGFCANSLELGCDCLGYIHYFDGILNNSEGEPYVTKKAICMHEEDAGILWKHVDYRTGHSEARRSRRLVISFIATVVNYEYLFYWYFYQDGSIDFEIKLSGELSTNVLSAGEGPEPEYGILVAPGVNAQLHQHMFCVRLDMAVDGHRNTVSEIDVIPAASGPKNPSGNAFRAHAKIFRAELDAQRVTSPSTARTWRIQNPRCLNRISRKPVAYMLIPYAHGPAQPLLLTSEESAVTRRGCFATKSLWVTPYRDDERWPAGRFTVQSRGGEGLPMWTAANRGIEDEDIVIWHSFGVAHIPRPEDFPVMPCESTGFKLKPDGFFEGNPGIDLRPVRNESSACCNSSLSTSTEELVSQPRRVRESG